MRPQTGLRGPGEETAARWSQTCDERACSLFRIRTDENVVFVRVKPCGRSPPRHTANSFTPTAGKIMLLLVANCWGRVGRNLHTRSLSVYLLTSQQSRNNIPHRGNSSAIERDAQNFVFKLVSAGIKTPSFPAKCWMSSGVTVVLGWPPPGEERTSVCVDRRRLTRAARLAARGKTVTRGGSGCFALAGFQRSSSSTLWGTLILGTAKASKGEGPVTQASLQASPGEPLCPHAAAPVVY